MTKHKEIRKESVKPHADCAFIGVWVPNGLADALDRAVQQKDSDRSKLVREALREKLQSIQEAA